MDNTKTSYSRGKITLMTPMIRSPLQSNELTGMAMQLKIMSDLMKMHKQFNDGLTKLAEYSKDVHSNAQEVKRHMARIDSLPPGRKGDKGDTPTVDLEAVKADVLARMPVLEPIEAPDIQDIAELAARMLPVPPEIDHELLADKVAEKITKGKKIKVEHIAGLREEVDSYRNQLAGKVYGKDTWARGGGDTVVAGTNVTFTKDANGNKIINASGSSGGNVAYNEVVSGSGTAWTLAHSPTTGTLRLYANGQRLTETVDYSIVGAAITTNSSWALGTVLADYNYP